MPGGGPHSFLAPSRSFAPHPFSWCRWGQRPIYILQPTYRLWPCLRGPWSLWDGKRSNWSMGHWAAAWENPGSTAGTVALRHPLHHLELSKPPPCKSQSWRRSQQGGKGAAGQAGVCYRAGPCFTGRSWSPHANLSLTASPHPPGTRLRQGTRQPGTATACQKRALPPQTLQGLLQLRGALGSALLDASVNTHSSPGSLTCVLLSSPWVGAHVTPHHTQRIQWLNAEDLGAVLLHPPKEMT